MHSKFSYIATKFTLVILIWLITGLSLPAGILEVGPTYTTIQEALNAATDGDIIVVYPGYYYENLNTLGKAVWLRSKSGADVTFIRPKIKSQPIILITRKEGPATIIEGFTFEKAQSNAVQISAASPTFVNCDFNYNAGDFGGAVAIFGGAPIMIGCHFYRNLARGKYPAGGAIHIRGGVLELINCDIRENEAGIRGGAIFVDNGKVRILHSNVMQNDVILQDRDGALGGGAVFCQNGEIFSSNTYWMKNHSTERGGAGYIINGKLRLQNCIIGGNLTVHKNGGAFYLAASDARFYNTTWVDNQAPEGQGGGFYTNRSPVSVLNSIFWQNKAPLGFHFFINGDSLRIDYSAANAQADGYAANKASTLHVGSNMVYENIVFTRDSTGLFRLAANSGGRNRGVPGPIWENPDAGRNTIGAYGGPGSGHMGAQPVIWDKTALQTYRRDHAKELTVWDETIMLQYITSGFGEATVSDINQLATKSTRAGFIQLAIRQFQNVLKTDPDNVGALLGLAGIYERQNRRDLAVKAWNQAYTSHPDDPQAAFFQAKLMYGQKKWADAIPLLNQVVHFDSFNGPAWLMLGRAALETGDFTRAQTALEEAIMVDTTSAEPYLWMAERADWMNSPNVAMWWLTGGKPLFGAGELAWLSDPQHLQLTRKGKAFSQLFPDIKH